MTQSSQLRVCKTFALLSFPVIQSFICYMFLQGHFVSKTLRDSCKNPKLLKSRETWFIDVHLLLFSNTQVPVYVCVCISTPFFQDVHCSSMRLMVKALQSRSCHLAMPCWLRTASSRPFPSTPKRRMFSASATHMETSTSSR